MRDTLSFILSIHEVREYSVEMNLLILVKLEFSLKDFKSLVFLLH
jgi:hypothetical protein